MPINTMLSFADPVLFTSPFGSSVSHDAWVQTYQKMFGPLEEGQQRCGSVKKHRCVLPAGHKSAHGSYVHSGELKDSWKTFDQDGYEGAKVFVQKKPDDDCCGVKDRILTQYNKLDSDEYVVWCQQPKGHSPNSYHTAYFPKGAVAGYSTLNSATWLESTGKIHNYSPPYGGGEVNPPAWAPKAKAEMVGGYVIKDEANFYVNQVHSGAINSSYIKGSADDYSQNYVTPGHKDSFNLLYGKAAVAASPKPKTVPLFEDDSAFFKAQKSEVPPLLPDLTKLVPLDTLCLDKAGKHTCLLLTGHVGDHRNEKHVTWKTADDIRLVNEVYNHIGRAKQLLLDKSLPPHVHATIKTLIQDLEP